MTVLICVWGVSPGVGKSTLCSGLSEWLMGTGLQLDHFREEEVLTRPQFSAVAREFGTTGAIELPTLLDATTQFVESMVQRGDDVVVADALMPYVPSLLAMGHSEKAIDTFMADLAAVLKSVEVVVVFLDGDAEAGLNRAASREEPGWLDWYVGKLAHYGVTPNVDSVTSAVRYLERERATMLRAAERQGWALVQIKDATELIPDEVLRAAKQQLRPWVSDDKALHALQVESSTCESRTGN